MKSNLPLLLVAIIALSGVVAAFADLARSPAELRASRTPDTTTLSVAAEALAQSISSTSGADAS